MTLSVITIVYNDVENILKTIQSVVNQTDFNCIEYIVIDGNSTDGTVQRIATMQKYIKKFISEPDKGIYDAMNKGLDCATGDFVIFLNSGDCFSSKHTISQVLHSISDPTIPIIYGTYREVRNGIVSRVIPNRKPNKIWYGPVASHQSTFYNLSFLRNHNLRYDLSYRIAADYKLTAQVLSIGKFRAQKLQICISDFDCSGTSSINQNIGLKEANRVRTEVLGWNAPAINGVTLLLLCARYTKKYLSPIYKLLRNL